MSIAMRFRNLAILVLFKFWGICNALSQNVEMSIVSNFSKVDSLINEKVKKHGIRDVLVVLDIDNTLLTSSSDLGGDFWYQWQNGELEIKPTPQQKLRQDCLFDEAISLLYELGTMNLTDSLIPGYLRNWQQSKVTIFALTSRSPKCRAATERELLRNNIDLTTSELKTVDENSLSVNYKLKREVSYMNGIFMTSGLNKGDMLSHIIGKSGKTFKAIIFVDDSKKNVDAVREKYSNCGNVDITILHYNKVVSERLKRNNNQIITQEQTDKMYSDWVYLLRTLNTVFPERLRKSKCNN
jgi:hypothetical protein